MLAQEYLRNLYYMYINSLISLFLELAKGQTPKHSNPPYWLVCCYYRKLCYQATISVEINSWVPAPVVGAHTAGMLMVEGAHTAEMLVVVGAHTAEMLMAAASISASSPSH